MDNIIKKQDCCGCEACKQACPLNCIEMKVDEDGFFYPKIQKEKCIACNLCATVCPVRSLKVQRKHLKKTAAYAAYYKNETVRELSSSGGIFSALAEKILEEQGIVFGAAFDGAYRVHHIAIDQKEKLHLLRGSKYVQSRIRDSFVQTKSFLEENRLVLYSGTPCQIAGLRTFLGKTYPNLYTVNILCHGVPSPALWSRYIEEMEEIYDHEVESICFRNKEKGWNNYRLVMEFGEAGRYEGYYQEDPYLKLFLGDICLRPSCYSCKWKGVYRPGDFTLGDAWGIEKILSEMGDDLGTSMLLVHTKKGQSLFQCIEGQLKWKEVNSRKLRLQGGFFIAQKHPNRKKLFEAYRAGSSIEELQELLSVGFSYRMRCILKKLFGCVTT